MMTLLFVTGNM